MGYYSQPVKIPALHDVTSATFQQQAPAEQPPASSDASSSASAPAASSDTGSSSGISMIPVVVGIVGIGVISGGGFLIRRWWIRRQNLVLLKK